MHRVPPLPVWFSCAWTFVPISPHKSQVEDLWDMTAIFYMTYNLCSLWKECESNASLRYPLWSFHVHWADLLKLIGKPSHVLSSIYCYAMSTLEATNGTSIFLSFWNFVFVRSHVNNKIHASLFTHIIFISKIILFLDEWGMSAWSSSVVYQNSEGICQLKCMYLMDVGSVDNVIDNRVMGVI